MIIKNKSFTLVEILVVIVVVGILSSFILVGLNSISKKSRDAKRETEIINIRNALWTISSMGTKGYPTTVNNDWCCLGVDDSNCTAVEAALGENIPRDPLYSLSTNKRWCYMYRSDGTNYELYVQREINNNIFINNDGFYNPIISREKSYAIDPVIGSPTSSNDMPAVDDSSNNALWGMVTTFIDGWVAYIHIQPGTIFTSGNYDMYIRLRSNGSGNSPNSLPWGIYNSTTALNMYSGSISGISTTYNVIYVRRITLLPENIGQTIRVWFSNSSITTQYYLDYVEFRPVAP
jgi:prepilin-type N-terminal cleavage/methylation domain-containing protein